MTPAAHRRASGRTVLLALVAGVTLVAGGRLFLRYYEPEVEIFEVGLQGEAAANRLLAAERLLPRLGYPVRRCDGESGLPPRDHPFFMLHRSLAVARLRKPALLAWMRQGGRLIVTPTPASKKGGVDPLLAELGIAGKNPESEWSFAREPFGRVQRLIDTRGAAAYAQGDEDGSTLLVFGYGKGELTVLNSAERFSNGWIGKDDNAALLVSLVRGRRDGARKVMGGIPPGQLGDS